MSLFRFALALGMLTAPLAAFPAQDEGSDVQARIEVLREGGRKAALRPASANIVVWLSPDPAVTNASLT